MNVTQTIGIFLNYHRITSKQTTLRNHEFVLARFCNQLGEREPESITSEEILSFLTKLTEGSRQSVSADTILNFYYFWVSSVLLP
jgi:site-specific recombinase XerD